MEVRLNKFLSQTGKASRREADKMIVEGRVKINGKIIRVLGYKINGARDIVEVDGKRVKKTENLIYLMLNKPSGYLVTLKDPFRRPTIKDLFPDLKEKVFPVGRLDYDSEGLMLLTNDGELAYRLTHPRFKIKKTYLVKVTGNPDSCTLSRLERGVFLDGRKTGPAKISSLSDGLKRTLLRFEIYEGRKREVKKMCEAIGHKVLKLKRIGFAGLTLGKLTKGNYRFLRQKEIDNLRKQVEL
ncbi:MAG: rRNA pseudouridine synthase [Candidatus Aminicenantes bacterium]|nr:MAG: rRNA pseudouridine synthase [Candidatus Aminicenantes bacterium]